MLSEGWAQGGGVSDSFPTQRFAGVPMVNSKILEQAGRVTTPGISGDSSEPWECAWTRRGTVTTPGGR